MSRPKRIVFTGGPGAGKTSIIDIIYRRYPDIFITIPEAASVLYSGGFPRIKKKDAIVHTQRAIYFLIKEIEDMYLKLYPDRIQLCDRGTLDGVAYWPENENEDFLTSTKTTLDKEFERYDYVIYLRSPRNPELYRLSPVRKEDHKIAVEIDIKTEKAWENHPRIFKIDDEKDFLIKVEKVVNIVEKICLKDRR